MAFHNHLKELRKTKNISQADIANYLGITRQGYSLYELGRRAPDYETLLKLGEFFDVSVDYILTGNENISLILTDHEKTLVSAYRNQPDIQPAVDRLLMIDGPLRMTPAEPAHKEKTALQRKNTEEQEDK